MQEQGLVTSVFERKHSKYALFAGTVSLIIADSVTRTNFSGHHAVSVFSVTRIRKLLDVMIRADGEVILLGADGT